MNIQITSTNGQIGYKLEEVMILEVSKPRGPKSGQLVGQEYIDVFYIEEPDRYESVKDALENIRSRGLTGSRICFSEKIFHERVRPAFGAVNPEDLVGIRAYTLQDVHADGNRSLVYDFVVGLESITVDGEPLQI